MQRRYAPVGCSIMGFYPNDRRKKCDLSAEYWYFFLSTAQHSKMMKTSCALHCKLQTGHFGEISNIEKKVKKQTIIEQPRYLLTNLICKEQITHYLHGRIL